MQLRLTLSTTQRLELEDMVNTGYKPYLRERAAALLKIADGQPGNYVAAFGLLKKRRKNTVYDWVARYQAEGIQGLVMLEGRGRKPSFSPSVK
jgi:transposase